MLSVSGIIYLVVNSLKVILMLDDFSPSKESVYDQFHASADRSVQ